MEVKVSAIIHSNEKALIVHKLSAGGRPKTFWELPGGIMQAGDISLEHTAIRSVFDELGIYIMGTGRWFSDCYKNILNIIVTAKLCDERQAYNIHHSKSVLNHAWIDSWELSDYELTPLTSDRITHSLTNAPLTSFEF